MIYVLLVFGLVLLAWATQRGKMDFEADYQKRRDDEKADLLVAEVRKELAEKKARDVKTE